LLLSIIGGPHGKRQRREKRKEEERRGRRGIIAESTPLVFLSAFFHHSAGIGTPVMYCNSSRSILI
jgi:hypothetical protein